MKAALIHAFGDPDVVTIGQTVRRDLQPGEVMVRVEAAGVNPLDVKILSGAMQQVFPISFPYVPGTDFSGVVEEVGGQVSSLMPGDRVVGRTTPGAGGAFGWELAIAATELCVIPRTMSFELAASLPTTFGTAWQGLFDLGCLRRGQRVLIHAAAGGVGIMAVQQAHRGGAHVVATASAKNVELVKSLGADEVIDYRTQDFTQVRDIDLVLDTLGGTTLEHSWSVLRAGGRIVSLVDFSIESRNGHDGEFVFFANAAPFLPEAIRQFQAGQIQIITDSIFSLDDVRSALERQATGHACGKVLIRMSH